MQSAGLHDYRQMRALMLQEIDIGYGVTIDQQQISDGTNCDYAQLSRSIEQRRISSGRRSERLGWRGDFGAKY